LNQFDGYSVGGAGRHTSHLAMAPKSGRRVFVVRLPQDGPAKIEQAFSGVLAGYRQATRMITSGGDLATNKQTSLTFDKFVEAARLPVLRLVLIKEAQLAFLEYLEELLPTDLLKIRFLLTEVDPKNAALVAGAYNGGPAVTRFCPFLDRAVIDRRVRTTHCALQIFLG
jgi:hypothetical protein